MAEKKTYKNIGQRTELGIAPGKTVTRTLDPATEQRLIDRGAIEVVGGGTPVEETTTEENGTSGEGTEGSPSGSTSEEPGKSGGRGALGRR